jgi:outer membrane protein
MSYRCAVSVLVCLLLLASCPALAAESRSTFPEQTAGDLTATMSPSTAKKESATPSSVANVVRLPAGPSVTSIPIAPGAELTLKQAISIALKYHPHIKETSEYTAAAADRVGEARSYLGPQLFGVGQDLGSTENGIGNTTFYDSEGAFPRMTGINHDLPNGDFSQSWSTSNNYMAGLAVSQFLFDFGRRRGFVSQRKFEAASASADEQEAKLGLIFEVSERYFDALQAKQLIRVYEKAVEQRQYHLHEARVKAEAGLRSQLDVYVTRAELERAQLHLLDARNAYADARVALNNALGLSDRAPQYHLADILTYSPVTESYQSLLATAFRGRPDLTALGAQIQALGAQVVEYKSDYYPTVSAQGGYAAMGTGLPASNNFNVGIVITWPIFNSFLTTSQVAETKAEQRAVQDAAEDLRQRIILQVHTAFLNWQASLARIQRAEEALAASRAELELAEKRYEAGLTNIVELEDAQRFYTSDDAAYANALYGFSAAKAAVDEATGRSLAGSS